MSRYKIPKSEKTVELQCSTAMWKEFENTAIYSDLCLILEDWLEYQGDVLAVGDDDRREEDKTRGRIEVIKYLREMLDVLPTLEEDSEDGS